MNLKHLLLALLVVFIWGLNFVVIRVGLNGFPPLLLCALRFGGAALPWVFFLPRPKAPLKFIIGYGIFTFALQFAFLFSGIFLGLSPGLASLVLQVQVFFSIGLAALFFHDRPSAWKLSGALISFIGIGVVGLHLGGGASFLGLGLTLLAALCWATGNMFSKKVDAQSALSLVVWGSLVALVPMGALSLLLEGPGRILASFQGVSFTQYRRPALPGLSFHPFWILRLGISPEPISHRNGGAVYTAGAGVWIPGIFRIPGRGIAGMENRRCGAGDGGPCL